MQDRAHGAEERPPVGLAAAPLLVLPEVYGTSAAGSLWIAPWGSNLLESAAAGFSGMVLTFFLAPLAWTVPRQRGAAAFYTVLAVLGVSWQFNLPILVSVARLPVLNMLSHNRFVFATTYALVSLAALGLEALRSGDKVPPRWFWVPGSLAAAVAAWCLVCAIDPPEPLATQLTTAAWQARLGLARAQSIQQIQGSFTRCYLLGAGLAAVAAIGWIGAWKGLARKPLWRTAIAAVALAELFGFAWRNDRQADRRLYFPTLPALQQLRDMTPARVLGIGCLPPNLNYWHGLCELRGYDAVDPGRLITLLDRLQPPNTPTLPYARSLGFVPILFKTSAGQPCLPPVLDMLSLRYFITRYPPPPAFPVVIQESGYWVAENPKALPRAFVPRAVRPALSDRNVLAHLTSPDFNPRELAYTEEGGTTSGEVVGSATITGENPSEVRLEAELSAPGVVVLADLWDPGWKATVDGQEAEVLRINYLIRGVQARAGRHTIVFRYQPASFTWGLRIAATAAAGLAVWAAALVLARRRGSRPGSGRVSPAAKMTEGYGDVSPRGM